LARSADLVAGSVTPATCGDDDVVVWRARNGAVCAQPRRCPHLDWDLADAHVAGDELVCAGHGWSFDTNGRAWKRTEHGRIDPKDDVETLEVRERDGVIEARPRHYGPPP
jgi:nitrite reductase/ring-hydroxylating ferredoxin subunit